jgi:D-arabinose 1-dehydrogenase-like Zn-dependent alcohol dehydrogenase
MPTMKAWQASAYGAEGNPADTIANLKLSEVEIPTAGAGQIQVKVDLAAVNPIDWKLFSGGLHGICPCAFPYTPGFDITGTVSALGEGTDIHAFLVSHTATNTRVSPPADDDSRSPFPRTTEETRENIRARR